MAGKRDWNLRQGDIAEYLGTLLLQGLSTVAPVPRTEDTGVDVVATLLRRESKRKLIATDSFYVQLKSASVKEICYQGEEVEWLGSLELPYFVGSVDLSSGEIKLFAAHELYRAMANFDSLRSTTKLRIVLKSGNPSYDIELAEWSYCFGPPVLHWGLAHLSDAAFLDHAYSVLSEHIANMKLNILSSIAGFHLLAEWQTNEKPKATRPFQTSGGDFDRLKRMLHKSWPLLHAWYFQLHTFGFKEQAKQLGKILEDLDRLNWDPPLATSMLHAIRRGHESADAPE